jgi:hypothetical protein
MDSIFCKLKGTRKAIGAAIAGAATTYLAHRFAFDFGPYEYLLGGAVAYAIVYFTPKNEKCSAADEAGDEPLDLSNPELPPGF